MNYKQVLTIILFFSMISSVLAIDVSWTVTEDVDLTTPKCIGSYALPEDETGFYDLTVISPNGEEFPITSYPVFPNEVFTYISCGHKIEFTSSPFIPTKQFISLPIRFRKASGMQVQIKVDDGDFTTLGVELSAEDCFDTAKYVSRNDEYFLPVKFVDNKPHTITIRVLDRDAFCNDLTQVWFGSVLSEKDSVTTTFFEDVEGRGVSNAQIVSAVVKAFFAGTIAEVSNEDTDVETELGQVYGLTPTPLPVILKEEEQQNAIEIDTKIDDLPDDYFDTPNIKPNTYEIILVEGNPNVAHFIDVYGNDKYTVDGTHFYENYGKAVAPGVKGMYNSFKDFIRVYSRSLAANGFDFLVFIFTITCR